MLRSDREPLERTIGAAALKIDRFRRELFRKIRIEEAAEKERRTTPCRLTYSDLEIMDALRGKCAGVIMSFYQGQPRCSRSFLE